MASSADVWICSKYEIRDLQILFRAIRIGNYFNSVARDVLGFKFMNLLRANRIEF